MKEDKSSSFYMQHWMQSVGNNASRGEKYHFGYGGTAFVSFECWEENG